MEEIKQKLDTIIKILNEINSKLGPAVNNGNLPAVPAKKLTKKQKFHQDAIAELEIVKQHDRARAIKKFAPQFEELRQLEEKFNLSKGD